MLVVKQNNKKYFVHLLRAALLFVFAVHPSVAADSVLKKCGAVFFGMSSAYLAQKSVRMYRKIQAGCDGIAAIDKCPTDAGQVQSMYIETDKCLWQCTAQHPFGYQVHRTPLSELAAGYIAKKWDSQGVTMHFLEQGLSGAYTAKAVQKFIDTHGAECINGIKTTKEDRENVRYSETNRDKILSTSFALFGDGSKDIQRKIPVNKEDVRTGLIAIKAQLPTMRAKMKKDEVRLKKYLAGAAVSGVTAFALWRSSRQ